ncbi:MAG: BrnT family toxin [Gemmatimonadota bacterium]
MVEFEWDQRKADANLAKHGVSFDEAMTVFGDSRAITTDDPDHSIDEHRRLVLAQSEQGRLLALVFTVRPTGVRLISARQANRRERRRYEEG